MKNVLQTSRFSVSGVFVLSRVISRWDEDARRRSADVEVTFAQKLPASCAG